MIVTNDNIGDIICRYESGERFVVKTITDNGLSVQNEDGTYGSLDSCIIDGGIERDEARIASFHTNLSLACVLNAAKAASERRLISGQYDILEQQNASRVSEVVNEQRSFVQHRLQIERQTLKAGHALAKQFLNDLIQKRTGDSAVFFGVPVQYCGDTEKPSFHVNDEHNRSKKPTLVLLSERTAESPVQAPSFDVLVKSATARASHNPEQLLRRMS